MSDEYLEEQAGLYVLGVLPHEEVLAFESAMSRDDELRLLVDALRISRDALAGSVPHVAPPSGLKEKILSQIEAQESILPFPARSNYSGGWNTWLPWALAACLAIVCGISISEQSTLRQKNGEMVKRMADLNQMADSLRSETESLTQTVALLKKNNQLQDVRVAVLGSQLADAPKSVAVSLWDEMKQRGVFVAQNLKPLPTDKDYQLWVIDPKYAAPVSAGVFQVDAQGNAHVSFKADKPIESASKFAVTMEPKGGLPTPTLKNLVLIGG